MSYSPDDPSRNDSQRMGFFFGVLGTEGDIDDAGDDTGVLDAFLAAHETARSSSHVDALLRLTWQAVSRGWWFRATCVLRDAVELARTQEEMHAARDVAQELADTRVEMWELGIFPIDQESASLTWAAYRLAGQAERANAVALDWFRAALSTWRQNPTGLRIALVDDMHRTAHDMDTTIHEILDLVNCPADIAEEVLSYLSDPASRRTTFLFRNSFGPHPENAGESST